MKTIFMQRVDRYVGQFLCRLASFFYLHKKMVPENVERVVIIKMFGMGSIVLMSPMIRAIQKRYPNVEISFVTFEGNQEVLGLYGVNANVYIIRRRSLFCFLWDSLMAILDIRRNRQDIVLDAEFFSRYTALLSIFLNANYRIGFYSRDIYRGDLIDYHAYFNPYRHMIENFLELTSPLKCIQSDQTISIPKLSRDVFGRLRLKLNKENIDPDKPIVLMNPNVSNISPCIDRSWPIEHFGTLAKFLQGKGFCVAFIGSPEQQHRTNLAAWQGGHGVISLSGKIDIEELLALMRLSFMIITNDSGPLHMAVSVGLPTYSFFGTESPVMYGHNHGLNRIFYLRLACSPCLSVFNYKRGRCEFNSRCLREIKKKDVIQCFEKDFYILKVAYDQRIKNITNYNETSQRLYQYCAWKNQTV